MSATVTLEEAQARLSDIVHKLGKGEEIAILEGQEVVARIVGERPPARKPREPGNCKGMITLLVEDDEHLKHFEDYMP